MSRVELLRIRVDMEVFHYLATGRGLGFLLDALRDLFDEVGR